MATRVIMPQMGESIFEGTITKWLKQVGDTVARDEPLFEISTDKVDSEIPSPAEGTLTEILVPEGKTVEINTIVALINGDDALDDKSTTTVEVFEEAVEPPSKFEGTPEPPAVATKSAKRPSKPETKAKLTPPEKRRKDAASASVESREVRTSPLVRRLAREHGINLSEIEGTGLNGRITKQDVLSYLDSRGEVPVEPAPAPEPPKPVAAVPEHSPTPTTSPPSVASPSETVPMTTMRKAIAEHMVRSRHTSAHVNTLFEVDMTSIVKLREQHKASFEEREGIKLTFTPFFTKALVESVSEFPILNCSVSGTDIVYQRGINVGIAVALETGLIVPVVKDSRLKSFTGLALEIQDLAERARTKKLRPQDVQDGTITITNPGVYGPLFGTPIINQPQVAILGIGGIEKRPVVVNDAIAIRSMVYLSLSFDHRVIDGAVADQFMANLKNRLQSWSEWTP